MNKDIPKFYFKKGFPFEFELIPSTGKLYLISKGGLSAPHRADFYNIIWYQKGNPTHWIDFEPVKIKANSLLFIGRDRVHGFDTSGNFDGKSILFTTDFYCQNESDRKFLQSTPLFNDVLNIANIPLGKNTPVYRRIYEAIAEEFNKTTDSRQQYILRNYLHILMLTAERERQNQHLNVNIKNSDLEIVLLYKDAVEKQFKSVKCVGSYSKQLRIYEKRLNIAAGNITGKTPKEIIDERILLEAKRLLAYSDYSVKEISNELGFDEPTNFIKYFRKHAAATPLEFRKKHKY